MQRSNGEVSGDNIKVIFNKPDRNYYVGDTLTVQIETGPRSRFEINEISSRIQCQAKTKWICAKNTFCYEDTQTYIDEKFILFKKPHGKAVKLRGRHLYKFSFELPHGIPPSCSEKLLGSLGCISYHISVTMDCPCKLNKTIQKPFFVQSLFDLNRYPSLREPAETIMKNNYWWCFNSGKISAVIRVPYKGYVVGQNILVTVQIENHSKLHINDIFVKMRKVITGYTVDRADTFESVETVKNQQSLGVKVKPGSKYAFCFNYVVPDVPVVNMMDCSTIDFQYELDFEVKLSGLTCNMSGKLPIIVGSLPFNNIQSAAPLYELRELIV